MKKILLLTILVTLLAICSILLWYQLYTYFWAIITIGLVVVFVLIPIIKYDWHDVLFYECQKNPLVKHIVYQLLQVKENKLSTIWLSRVEQLHKEDIPKIEWTEDAERSKGIDSFYCLDQYSDDCRQLLHPSYNIVRDDRLWFRSKFTNEYYFEPQCSPAPRYEIRKSLDKIAVKTGTRIDTWIYLVSKQKYPPIYANAIEFDFTPHTEMQETLQIDFCCHSLARRFRYNLENNRTLKFDITDKGCFTYWNDTKKWNKHKKKCSLSLHQTSHVRLEVIRDIFAIYYNNHLEMAVHVKDYVPELTSWYLIFWNGTEVEQHMDIELANFKAYISKKSSIK